MCRCDQRIYVQLPSTVRGLTLPVQGWPMHIEAMPKRRLLQSNRQRIPMQLCSGIHWGIVSHEDTVLCSVTLPQWWHLCQRWVIIHSLHKYSNRESELFNFVFSGELSATCYCDLGYEGDRCETNIDECQSNPCQNNATCVDGVNSFHCRCLPGTKGKYCEEGETPSCGNAGSARGDPYWTSTKNSLALKITSSVAFQMSHRIFFFRNQRVLASSVLQWWQQDQSTIKYLWCSRRLSFVTRRELHLLLWRGIHWNAMSWRYGVNNLADYFNAVVNITN
jgi:hypothetical protein